MKGILLLLMILGLGNMLSAQRVYTIQADSVKLTGCDSSELIIENHTQNVPGFLYNTGHGRTMFKHGVVKLNDSLYQIGGDTLKVRTNSWVQGGNAFGATGVLGTMDSNHLDFYTHGIQRTRLTSAGNLLLGTTTDNGAKLQVNGDINVNDGAGSSLATYSGGSMGLGASGAIYVSSPVMRFLPYAATNVDSFYLYMAGFEAKFRNPAGTPHGYAFDISNGSSDINIQPYGDGSGITQIANNGTGSNPYLKFISNMRFVSNSAVGGVDFLFTAQRDTGVILEIQDSAGHSRFFVNGPTGDVVVNGGTDDGNNFQVSGSGSFSDSLVLKTMRPGTSVDSVLVWNATTHAVHVVSPSSFAALSFPGSSVASNGVIRAHKLILDEKSWPDYVFAAGYPLTPLSEVEKYIQKNKHLLGIPSAAAVKGEGVDIGENQAALLKKIEELTLYNIGLSKEVESLRQEMAELKKMITTKADR